MKFSYRRFGFVCSLITFAIPNLCSAYAKRGCPFQGGYPKSYEQGYEVSAYQMLAAYNAPDQIDLKRSWDLFVDGAFIWWNGSEEGLEFAVSDPNGNSLPINEGHVINLDFKYKPGFKVGLGMRARWDVSLKYTWLHFTNRSITSAPNPTPPGSLYPLQTHSKNVQNVTVDRAEENWKLDLDVLDLELAKPYYVGTQLSFRTFMGLKGQLLDQNLNTGYRNQSTTQTFHVKQSSNSWAIGPRVGVDANWMVGGGVRLLGNVAESLLYTQYDTSRKEENAMNPSLLAVELANEIHGLQPISEFQMGIGYSTYSFYRTFHFDIYATYDFHIHWNQNVFRLFVSDVSEGASFVRNGDLFLHGLTLNIKLDF